MPFRSEEKGSSGGTRAVLIFLMGEKGGKNEYVVSRGEARFVRFLQRKEGEKKKRGERRPSLPPVKARRRLFFIIPWNLPAIGRAHQLKRRLSPATIFVEKKEGKRIAAYAVRRGGRRARLQEGGCD